MLVRMCHEPQTLERGINRALGKYTEERRRWRECSLHTTCSKIRELCVEKEIEIRLKVIRGKAIQASRINR